MALRRRIEKRKGTRGRRPTIMESRSKRTRRPVIQSKPSGAQKTQTTVLWIQILSFSLRLAVVRRMRDWESLKGGGLRVLGGAWRGVRKCWGVRGRWILMRLLGGGG